jgi:hypothetical protein
MLLCVVNNLTPRRFEGTMRFHLQRLVGRERFLLRPTNPTYVPSKFQEMLNYPLHSVPSQETRIPSVNAVETSSHIR